MLLKRAAFASLLVCALFGFVTLSSAVSLVQSSRDGGDRLTPKPEMDVKDTCPATSAIKINVDERRQSILGFGGAFTEAAASVFSKLPEKSQLLIMEKLFGADGIRYNLGRTPMGSCDFSLGYYNFDNVKNDDNLEHFSTAHNDALIYPFIRAAQNMTTATMHSVYNRNDSDWDMSIILSPWSAPGWMKENGHMSCFPLSCLGCVLKEDKKDVYAHYFSKSVSSYLDNGINVWGVTVQNEPGACSLTYEGMHFTDETERDFVRDHLGPRLSADHPNLKVLGYDHNKDHIVRWANTLYSDKDVNNYLWGIAFHWYSGDQFDHLATTHDLFPDKHLLATEATVAREKDPTHPEWSHAEHYAHDMIGDLRNWAEGFIDWNLVLDMLGGPDHAFLDHCEGLIKCGSDAMIIANPESGDVYFQDFYYSVGHTAKFVPRGSVNIGSTGVGDANDKLEFVSFVSSFDESVVVIVLNQGDDSVDFSIFAGKNCLPTSIPGHSIQTYNFQKSELV